MAKKTTSRSEGEAHYFATPAAFRRWLEKNHDTAAELWVGYYKKGTGRPSLTWPESVDQALCFGWIDGIRKSVDEERYRIRFTPRKPTSIWSAVNIRRAAELSELNLMHAAGLAAFRKRDDARSRVYAFERETVELPADMVKLFRANRAAWAFFQAQPPGYRRTASWWVVSAKQDATRQKRLATLIADSAAGRRIGQLRRDSDRT